MKPAVTRSLYRDLAGNSSVATNEHIAEIDGRVRILLDMEDPHGVLDLRTLQTGCKVNMMSSGASGKRFWRKWEYQLMIDWWHGLSTKFACTISARSWASESTMSGKYQNTCWALGSVSVLAQVKTHLFKNPLHRKAECEIYGAHLSILKEPLWCTLRCCSFQIPVRIACEIQVA